MNLNLTSLFLSSMLILASPFAEGLTISVSGTITVANGGSLYSVGQPVEIVLTSNPTLGLPNELNIPNYSWWNGGFGLYNEPNILVWSNITVSSTTGTWPNLTQDESQSSLVVHPGADRVGLGMGSQSLSIGLNLFNAGIELRSVGGELIFLPGNIPVWPGIGNETIENVLPATGTYLVKPLGDFALVFLDGSSYILGGDASDLSVAINSVPEPSVFGLSIIGLVAVGFRRRK